MVHLEKNFLCQVISTILEINTMIMMFPLYLFFYVYIYIYLDYYRIYFFIFWNNLFILLLKIATSIYFNSAFRLKMFFKKLSMSSWITFSHLMPLSRNVKNVQRLTYVECSYSLNQRNDNIVRFWTQPQHHSTFRLNKWVTKGNVR